MSFIIMSPDPDKLLTEFAKTDWRRREYWLTCIYELLTISMFVKFCVVFRFDVRNMLIFFIIFDCVVPVYLSCHVCCYKVTL